MFSGIGFSWLLNWLFGPENTGIEVLGNLSINFLQFSVPNLGIEAIYVLQQLLTAGFAIAVVGALQATVIARAIADHSGQSIDKNKELAGQGMSNVVGSFFLSFAGSSSFNRSIVHYQAGAKTPLSAVFTTLLLIGFVFLGETIIGTMPIAVMSAVLIMVGWGLINLREFRRIFHLRSEAVIFYLTFFTALMFGLTDAVFFGMAASLFVYLKGITNPNLTSLVEDNGARHVLQIRGHLFFGTLTHLTNHVRKLMRQGNSNAVLVIDLREVTYIDWAAVRLLRRIGQEWRDNGGKFVLRVLENQQEKTLGMANQLGKIGGERQVA
jgi:SulP family sulfate permease